MVAKQLGAWRHVGVIAGFALGVTALSCTGSIDNLGPQGSCADCNGAAPNAGMGSGSGATDSSEMGGVGDSRTPNGVGYSTRFPKLSNAQWERSVQDLLRLDQPSNLSDSFTQEPGDKGYDNVGAATLTVSGDAWTRYQSAAETLAEQVSADAAKLAKILPSGTFANDTARGDAFIAQFGARAYRRPLTSAEKQAYAALFAQGPALVGGSALNAGVRLVLEALLQSPSFLYRVESATNDKNKNDPLAALSSYEMATRLSYALTGTTPNDELLKAADAGELSSEQGIVKWAGKLLDAPAARALLLSFHEQTFSIAAYGTQDKDAALKFDAEALAPALKEEAERFLGLAIDQGGGIAQLLTSPITFVNQDTAALYGLSGVTGAGLVQRTLDEKTRAGLFTQLGFLTKNATRTGSDPVHRGLTILRKVLCDEPDPPPMMFELPKPMPGLTTRQVYERSTACGVGCHDTLINPPGFAFEGFDTLGSVRTMEEGKPIDATGTLTLRDGFTAQEKLSHPTTKISFNGAVELMARLVEQPRVHECYARNFMKYVLAREVQPVERGASSALGEQSHKTGSMRALLLSLVKLTTFRSRVSDPQ